MIKSLINGSFDISTKVNLYILVILMDIEKYQRLILFTLKVFFNDYCVDMDFEIRDNSDDFFFRFVLGY